MVDSVTGPQTNAEAGPSRPNRPRHPSFRPATSFLPSSAAIAGSLRNASSTGTSNGANLQPEPSDEPGITPATASTSAGGESSPSVPPAEGEPAAPAGPVKPVHRSASSKNAIVYSAVQRRNPVLGAIKNVPTEIGDIPADYQVGTHNGVLYLSLKYHRLHPEYIHSRIEKMKGIYQLRILMILCDVTEHQQSLRELTKIAIVNNLSTIVAWSNDEIAQYLSTFKQFEHKSADTLKEKVHQTYHDQLQHVLTSGKKVNKTDAFNMASQFGSFANVSSQSAKMIATVKGLGPTKVTTLVDAFTKPFLVGGLKRSADDSTLSGPSGGEELAVPGVGVTNSSGKARREGSREKGTGTARGVIEVGSDDERGGSPDWPSESDEDDDIPTRIPGPDEPRRPTGGQVQAAGADGVQSGAAKGSEVWRDPLEEDEGSEEMDDDTSEGGARHGKRQRVK